MLYCSISPLLARAVVLRALRWNLTVVMLGYEVTRQWLFERVLGVNEKVYKRLQALAVKGIL
jgi:hypothetical protein